MNNIKREINTKREIDLISIELTQARRRHKKLGDESSAIECRRLYNRLRELKRHLRELNSRR